MRSHRNPISVFDPDGQEGIHVVNSFPTGDVGANLEKSIQTRLANAGVNYYPSGEHGAAFFQKLLSDPTNDVILIGHTSGTAGVPELDFKLGNNPELKMFASGIGQQINVKSLSIIGCGSTLCPITENLTSTPGVRLLGFEYSDRMTLLGAEQALAMKEDKSLSEAAEVAKKKANDPAIPAQPGTEIRDIEVINEK